MQKSKFDLATTLPEEVESDSLGQKALRDLPFPKSAEHVLERYLHEELDFASNQTPLKNAETNHLARLPLSI